MSWRPCLVSAFVALVVLAGCGHAASSHPALSYSTSVEPGALTIAVADHRPGTHTVWVVLRDPPKGVPRAWLTAVSDGDGSDVDFVSGRREVPTGTYRFVLYSAPGQVSGVDARYWTPEHRVGEGVAWVD
jgi:hypothetical protein